MPYIILKTDGTTLTTVLDGQFDSITTSLSLIGKNLFDFGKLQNENFVHLLENFADNTAPPNQLTGQLWFDTTDGVLKVYNGSAWRDLAVITVSTSSATVVNTGNLWYDTINGQLSINTGTGLIVIGPDAVPGFGTTRFQSTKLIDTSNQEHPVILCYVDGEVVSITSADAFFLNASNPIAGFAGVIRGITLKDGASKDVELLGASTFATSADSLLNASSSSYIVASTGTVANTLVERDVNADVTARGLNASLITAATTGSFFGTWNLNNNFLPQINGGVDLGSSLRRWGVVYTTILDSGTVNAGTLNFTSLIDSNLAGINRFDTDGTLVANSNNRLSTQRAVKTYVDTRFAAIPPSGSGPTGFTGSSGSPGGGGPTGFTGSSGGGGGGGGPTGFTGSSGSPGGGGGGATPPNLYHVTSGFTSGGRVIVKASQPTLADLGAGSFQAGDIWFDPSAATGYTQSAAINGWTKLPNGILVQWGRFETGTPFKEGVVGPLNFNTNFTAPPWSIVATPLLISPNTGADGWVQVITSSLTVSQFSLMSQRENNNDIGINGFTWIAVGSG